MKKLLSVCLTLALCLGLAVPALAVEQEDQVITVNEESYNTLLSALLSEEENVQVTVRLDSDVDLHAFSVVLGESDYGGLMGGQVMTVASHDVTIDLNGHTLTGEKDFPVFEVQDGYKLTVIDSSADKTGKLVSQGSELADVKDGGEFNYDAAGAEKPDDAKPEQPEDTKPEQTAAAGASDWAKELVGAAIEEKLVPEDLQNGYQNNITRLEFCRLAVALVERASGKTAAGLAAGQGVPLGDPFTDTHNDAAIAAAALGIISGRGDGIFDPDASITRQEAAVMLMKAGKVLGTEAPSAASIPAWNDAGGIQSWADEAVTYVASLGVMGSTDTTQAVFSPAGQYTREMSYITSLRLFQAAEK